MKKQKTIKVIICKSRNWYKEHEVYDVKNYLLFYDEKTNQFTNFGDVYFKVKGNNGYILVDDCVVLHKPQEEEELIKVPENIKFGLSCGIISDDGIYLLGKSDEVSAYYVTTNFFNKSSVKHYLKKIDFKDIKPGDVICDDIEFNSRLVNYNIVVSENEWRYWDNNTPVVYNSITSEDNDYYKVVTKD